MFSVHEGWALDGKSYSVAEKSLNKSTISQPSGFAGHPSKLSSQCGGQAGLWGGGKSLSRIKPIISLVFSSITASL